MAMEEGSSSKRNWKTPNELVTLKRGKRSRPNDIQEEEKGIHVPENCKQEPTTSQSLCSQTISLGAGALGDIDWCLKSKIRITSEQDFEWMNVNELHYEARALATLHQNKTETMQEPLIQFHQSRVVWMHPFFPFVDLFPRMENKKSVLKPPFSINDRETTTLKEHWSTSLHSLFQLLQCGHCPYFYVCANSLTILFLSGQISKPNGVALLSPTTSGFRSAMKRQGIPFNMPCSEVSRLDDTLLEDMITQEALHHAHAETANLKSMVKVEGSAFHRLLDFILTNKTILYGDGRLANIPPTLLAPNQFLGATLHMLKMKRCTLKEVSSENGQLVDHYCIDLIGPILPHSLQLLTTALNHAKQQYHIKCQKYEATSTFNHFNSQ